MEFNGIGYAVERLRKEGNTEEQIRSILHLWPYEMERIKKGEELAPLPLRHALSYYIGHCKRMGIAP